MDTKKNSCYRRVIVKYSGEALLGEKEHGVDSQMVEHIASELKPVVESKIQVGIIIGGGNFFRGAKLNDSKISRITGDHLGMVATMLNTLMLRDYFNHLGIKTKAMSAVPLDGIIERYSVDKACEYLEQNYVVIFAGGTGNPLVTTDTALSLRGIELEADLLLKATNVDGVYTSDPRNDSQAKLYESLTYKEALVKELAVMDLNAFCLCRDHNKKLRVFNLHKKGVLNRIVMGENEGTLVQ